MLKESKKFSRITLLIIVLGLSFVQLSIRTDIVIPSLSKSSSNQIFSKDFDSKIEDYMNEGHITSLATSITYKDEVYWSRGYGENDDSNAVFMIGSITKSVTATAVLQLLEKGLIKDLNDDVSDYLPFNVKNPKMPNDTITIKKLLSHRAGLNDLGTFACVNIPFSQMFNESPIFHPDFYTNETYLPYPLWVQDYFSPNGRYYNENNWMSEPVNFEYSNCGYFLLGNLIEKVTNQSLENYFYQNIFKPLRMYSTHMYLDNYSSNNLVEGNIWVKDDPELFNEFGLKNVNSPLPQYDAHGYGAGGLHSTSQDMAKFLLAQENGSYKGIQILSPESINLMHSNQGTDTGYFHEGEYGFGWMIGEKTFTIGNSSILVKTQGHGGNTPYYWAHIRNVNQIFQNGTIGNDTIGIVLYVNQGYNLRTNDSENNFPNILDYITQYALENLLLSPQSSSTHKNITGFIIETTSLFIIVSTIYRKRKK